MECLFTLKVSSHTRPHLSLILNSPIVKAIVKSCKGKIRDWPRMLPYALWADRTTHSSVTGYMLAELILGQKPIMPIEESIMSWTSIPWREEVSIE